MKGLFLAYWTSGLVLDEAGLELLFFLNKIIKGKNLTTVPQCYVATKNLLVLEYLQVLNINPRQL